MILDENLFERKYDIMSIRSTENEDIRKGIRLLEGKGFVRKYKGYSLYDTEDNITVTDPHGKTVATERSEVAAEGRIDEVTKNESFDLDTTNNTYQMFIQTIEEFADEYDLDLDDLTKQDITSEAGDYYKSAIEDLTIFGKEWEGYFGKISHTILDDIKKMAEEKLGIGEILKKLKDDATEYLNESFKVVDKDGKKVQDKNSKYFGDNSTPTFHIGEYRIDKVGDTWVTSVDRKGTRSSWEKIFIEKDPSRRDRAIFAIQDDLYKRFNGEPGVYTSETNLYNYIDNYNKKNPKLGESLNEKKNVSIGDKIYDELTAEGYRVYSNRKGTGYEIFKKNKENLNSALEILKKYDIQPEVKTFLNKFYITIDLPDYENELTMEAIENNKETILIADEVSGGKLGFKINSNGEFEFFKNDVTTGKGKTDKAEEMISQMKVMGFKENTKSLEEDVEGKYTIAVKKKDEPWYSTYMFIVKANSEQEAIEKAKASLEASGSENNREILGADPTTEEDIKKGIHEIKSVNESISNKELNELLAKEDRFKYQMLSRMQSDCEYFLNWGRGNVNVLWAKNIDDQIEYMKALYNSLEEKPDWLTMEEIDDYKNKMKNYNSKLNEETKDINELTEAIPEEVATKKQAEKDADIENIKQMIAKYEKGSLGDKITASELKDMLKQKLSESFEDEHLGEIEDEQPEEVPAAPEAGPDTGLAKVISDLIKDEWEAIDGYNSAIVNAEAEGRHDIAEVLTSIDNEEHLHVGELEKILGLIAPQAEQSIPDGREEARDILTTETAHDMEYDSASIVG